MQQLLDNPFLLLFLGVMMPDGRLHPVGRDRHPDRAAGEVGARIDKKKEPSMSAILPPPERLWWKHPLDRVEGTWIAIAFVWCMIMFFMMVGWHIYGKQNLSTETYKTTPDKFTAKAQAMVDKYTVRTETDEKTRWSRRPRAATST
jgi:hypothetical protein